MATTIKLKNGSGAPLAGDLVQGEPAFDLTNKRLYTEDSGGTVIEVGTNPTSLTTGTFTSTGIDDNATSTAITIDSSENVGIGTASPAYPLQVNGKSYALQSVNANGSASAPSYAFGNDEDCGMYRATTNAIGFSTDGTERMRIDSSGEVLSSASGSWRLRPDANSALAPAYAFNGDGNTGMYSPTSDTLGFSTQGTEKMRIDSSGNVGIGTTSPSYRLQMDGESAIALQIKSSSDTGTSSVFFADPTANTPGFVQYAHTDNAFRFGTNGSERVRIDASGNVGIGTASPATTLHVETSGNTGIQLRSGTASYGNINFNDGATAKGQILYNHNGDYMRLYVNGAERMRIDSSGRVGIGTDLSGSTNGLIIDPAMSADPSSLTEAIIGVAAAGYGLGGDLHLSPRTGTGNRNIIFHKASGGTEAMRIDSSGNLLVGQTTVSLTAAGVALLPTGELYVVRDSGATAYFNREGSDGDVIVIRNDNVTVGSISVSGSTTSYNPSSDVRLKENIRDYDNALADVMKLKPRKYSWKTDGAEDNGFIAQELMETPEFANRVNPIDDDSDDPMYGVDYMKFVAVLTGAIQEQQVMIEELKAEVAALKGA